MTPTSSRRATSGIKWKEQVNTWIISNVAGSQSLKKFIAWNHITPLEKSESHTQQIEKSWLGPAQVQSHVFVAPASSQLFSSIFNLQGCFMMFQLSWSSKPCKHYHHHFQVRYAWDASRAAEWPDTAQPTDIQCVRLPTVLGRGSIIEGTCTPRERAPIFIFKDPASVSLSLSLSNAVSAEPHDGHCQ